MKANGVLQGQISDAVRQKFNDTLAKNINKFQLIDTDGNVYYEGDIENVYYDKDGVLTATFMIPYKTSFKNTNKYFRILNSNGEKITDIETYPIVFDYGFGGLQTVKFPIKSEPGEIVFKEADYIDYSEMEDIYLAAVVAMTNNFQSIQDVIVNLKEKVDNELALIRELNQGIDFDKLKQLNLDNLQNIQQQLDDLKTYFDNNLSLLTSSISRRLNNLESKLIEKGIL